MGPGSHLVEEPSPAPLQRPLALVPLIGVFGGPAAARAACS